MKKVFLAVVCVLGLVSFANAQERGDIQINAGIGFNSSTTPVYAGVDFFVTDDISVGGLLSYGSESKTLPVAGKFSMSILGIGANGNYHFNRLLNLPEEWDVYAGLNLTYSIYNVKSQYTNFKDDNEFDFGAQVGGRYFFTPNWGVNLEFGGNGDVSGGKVGITYRL